MATKWSPDILLIDLPDGSALSGTSKALLISALQTMMDRWQWDDMSGEEWDIIENAVAVASNEVMADA